MGKTITISPVSRINGLWRIDVVVEGGIVQDALSCGIYYRGIEKILTGRDPRDAVYFTQRICGICSTAHAFASSMALENTCHVEIPSNAILLRNLIFGADLLQNHLRQFYLLALPDWVEMPQTPPFIPRYQMEGRLPKEVNDRMVQNYLDSLELHRLCHEMVTIFGGKAPHTHGIVAGGATVPPNADNVRRFSAILAQVKQFIKDKLLPDAYDLGHYYPEYYQLGKRELNMLSYGMFLDPDKRGETIFKPGTVLNGEFGQLNDNLITEEVHYAWYEGEGKRYPGREISEANMDKEEAYSWVKAPRYNGLVMETGPVSRLWLSNDYRNGNSTHDRKLARCLEAQLVGELMTEWLTRLEPGKPVFTPFELPGEAEGKALIEAMRWGLGHWIRIQNRKIGLYQVITPSAWNCSPRDDQGVNGAIEQALIGTPINDLNNPVEIGRIVRSFDPCLSCAVHLISSDKPLVQYLVN